MESWKYWENQIVDNTFPLNRYLGGDAVFLTEHEGNPAAIKIVAADETRLKQWRAAEKLSHPHLIRLMRSGRCELDGKDYVYAVMEYAEEDLSQVLPERALTAQEARDVLGPALSALTYLHGQGLPAGAMVHGRLKPSNILAVGDQVKLSTDRVAPGDTADDVKALGSTLVEVLTQRRPMWPHLPETLEQPFRDIAEHTLHPDSKKRWTLAQISARLQGNSVTRRAPIRWQYLLPIGAAALAILVFAWRSGGSRTETPPEPAPSPASVVKAEPAPAPPPVASKPQPVHEPAAPEPTPPPAPKATVKPAPPVEPEPEPETKPRISTEKVPGVEQEFMPEIPRKAVNTIHGTMIVNVRLHVDPSGSVSDAKLDSPAASRYFSKYILAAAKRWKFGPSDAPHDWTLRFVFTRNEMKVQPRRVS
jgi:TonB family protein